MADHSYATGDTEFQHLLSIGFSDEEAEKIKHMKDHVSDQVEYREILQQSRRLSFMRWLIEHDRMSR